MSIMGKPKQPNKPQGQQPSQSYQQPTPPSAPLNSQKQKRSVMAIVGLILAIIFPLAGLIVSIIALVQIKKNPNLTGKGMAIFGIIISLLMFAVPFLVALGSLAYFGVLSPDKFLPERCTGPAGLDCIDAARIDVGLPGSVSFSLQNNMGFPIQITSISGFICNVNSYEVIEPAPFDYIENKETFLIITRCDTKRGRFSDEFEISYLNQESGLNHKATITITGEAS